MSSGATDIEIPEHSIDPRNLRAELVRQFQTTCRMALKGGLNELDLHTLVDQAVQVETAKPAPLPVPELLGKGINDMRVNRDSILPS